MPILFAFETLPDGHWVGRKDGGAGKINGVRAKKAPLEEIMGRASPNAN
jgi:hypothetical protein